MSNFDPIRLEVLRNALEASAQEMGVVLKCTAFSPNIKERMDASCAIFNAEAELVAQAEHVPVHLGSMLKAVGPTLAELPALKEGDVVIVNDPFIAGAHLPDITLIAPVFAEGELVAHVASRAHHSDVGGMEPGSMPGSSTEIYQEGLIIPPVLLYDGGVEQSGIMRMVLANVRTPEERRGDLNAQLAALRVGETRIHELAARFGVGGLKEGLSAILAYSERRMLKRLAELPPGRYVANDWLDDDGSSPERVMIKVAVEVSPERLVFDFEGTAPQRRGNVNAVKPMTHSAVFYAIKILTDATLPPNAGVLRPVEIRIPPALSSMPVRRRLSVPAIRRRPNGLPIRCCAPLPRSLPIVLLPPARHDEPHWHRRDAIPEALGLHLYRNDWRWTGRASLRPGNAWRSMPICRTRSTHRSRRSKSVILCASNATNFAKVRAAAVIMPAVKG